MSTCKGCINMDELRCIHGKTPLCRHPKAPLRAPRDGSASALVETYMVVTPDDPRLLPETLERPSWCPGFEAVPPDPFEEFLKRASRIAKAFADKDTTRVFGTPDLLTRPKETDE